MVMLDAELPSRVVSSARTEFVHSILDSAVEMALSIVSLTLARSSLFSL